MGIRMDEAFHEKENKIIKVENASKKLNGELYCKTKECRIPVIYVKSHYRKGTLIPAYFRRKSKAHKHIKGCEYSVEGKIKVIAKDSDSKVMNKIEEENNDEYNFRLHIIHESLDQLESESNKNDSSKEENKNHSKDKDYQSKGELDSYLLTMKQIMELRSKVENNKKLRERITLQFKDQTIDWSDFYYNTKHLLRCYRYLKKMDNKEKHPICIEGNIFSLEEPNDYYDQPTLRLNWEQFKDDEDEGTLIPSVYVTIYNDDVIDYLKSFENLKKRRVIFYSNINPYPGHGKKKKFLNIQGFIYHRNQIKVF